MLLNKEKFIYFVLIIYYVDETMGNNNSIIKVIIIGFVFLSIGMVIIQSTGSSYKDPFDNVAMNPDDFTQSGIQQNKNLILHNKLSRFIFHGYKETPSNSEINVPF